MRTLLAVLIALQVATPAWSAAPLRRAHVVLIGDNRCNLPDCINKGCDWVETIVRKYVPASRRTITRISGQQVSPRGILAALKRLPVRRDEALFVYSISHGSYSPGVGHAFNFTGGDLPRAALLRAMKARGAALTILYTECCSNVARVSTSLGDDPSDSPPRERGRWGNALTDLLLCDRGVVDITAARPGQRASARRDCGGNLTGALVMAVKAGRRGLDRNGDGQVTWREAFGYISRTVPQLYRSATLVGQKTQQPMAYSLGGPRASTARP